MKTGSASNNVSFDASGVKTNNGTAITNRANEVFRSVQAKSDTAIMGATVCIAATQVLTTTTNPDVPRVFTITNTGFGSATGSVIVTGVLTDGTSSAESIAITSGGVVIGSKAFTTVINVTLSSTCDATNSISVGTTDKIGLANSLHGNSTFVYKVKQGTADIIVPAVDGMNSTIEFSTITNGIDYAVWYKY